MRHRKDHRKLSRTHQHRRALLRNLVTALFQYERIETTVAKAKEARRLAERMITFAKRGAAAGEKSAVGVATRRTVARFVTRPDVIVKLFGTIAPWYETRQGGYTRIVRIGRRLGDAGETAYLELVKSAEQREQDRSARIAAAESKALRQSGEEAPRKKAKDADTGEAPEETRPKRGRRKEGAGAGAGGGGGARTKRTGPRKVGGG